MPSRSDVGTTFTGEKTVSTGWGKLSDDDSGAASTLYEAEDRIVLANSVCDDTYGSTITKGHICINTKDGSGVCSGDSGGPLNLPDGNNVYKQIGVASFVAGSGCESKLPHAYTRVSEYLDFIEQTTGRKIE